MLDNDTIVVIVICSHWGWSDDKKEQGNKLVVKASDARPHFSIPCCASKGPGSLACFSI
jgi:hypothetical protein